MLDIQNISKTFEKGTVNEHVAINNLSLKLEDGEFVTVVGSNGAGKSTLFNAICGSFMVDEGHIFLDDMDITYKSEHSRAITKKKIQFFRENLARYNMGIEDRMKTKIGLLSGGQRQVVTLLMCTLSIPKLLLLDEHTAALDPATAEKVMDITKKIVQENNITTMMITHNLKQSLTTGTRTIMLDSGEIILDLSGEERKNTTMEDMIKMYSMKKQKEFDNDRILLSQ